MSRLSIVFFLILIFFVVVPAYGENCTNSTVGDPYREEIGRIPVNSWVIKEPVLPTESIMCYFINMTEYNVSYGGFQLYPTQCYCNVTGQWELVGDPFPVLLSNETDFEENETGREVKRCCSAVPSPCPHFPSGYSSVQPRDPGIASRAFCRGACGGDCPGNPIKVRRYNQSGDCYYKCSYDIWVCGTHRCCRDHDRCYDRCASAGWPALCRRGCDSRAVLCARGLLPWWIPPAIREAIALGICASWASGHGPFDGYLTFSDPPIYYGLFFGPGPS